MLKLIRRIKFSRAIVKKLIFQLKGLRSLQSPLLIIGVLLAVSLGLLIDSTQYNLVMQTAAEFISTFQEAMTME